MTALRSIPFDELVSNEALHATTIALVGVTAPTTEEEASSLVKKITEFFQGIGFFGSSLSAVAVSKILGNVFGEEGRSDLLVHLSGDLSETNPLKRMGVANWVKWTEDFVVNYSEDYESV